MCAIGDQMRSKLVYLLGLGYETSFFLNSFFFLRSFHVGSGSLFTVLASRKRHEESCQPSFGLHRNSNDSGQVAKTLRALKQL